MRRLALASLVVIAVPVIGWALLNPYWLVVNLTAGAS